MNHKELTQFSNLIGLIYEGATDLNRWTTDILPAICEYMEMAQCLLFTTLHTHHNGGYLFAYGMDAPMVDLYINRYQSEDVWILAGIEQNVFIEGNVVIGDELVPRQQLLESSFYKECLSKRPHMGQMIAGIVFGNDSTHSMPAACSMMRAFDTPLLNDDDRKKLQLILPHLSRAFGVLQRIRTAELSVASTLAALKHLGSAIILLNPRGEVAYINQAAERLLDENDVLGLHQDHPAAAAILTARESRHAIAIHDAIQATLKRDPFNTPHFSQCVSVPKPSGGNIAVQISSLGEHNEFGDYAAIVFLSDSRQVLAINPLALQDIYGLTPAEARVAIALLENNSAREVAEALGTSPNTVRTQIHFIYNKMGVDSRARFVRLMLGLATNIKPS